MHRQCSPEEGNSGEIKKDRTSDNVITDAHDRAVVYFSLRRSVDKLRLYSTNFTGISGNDRYGPRGRNDQDLAIGVRMTSPFFPFGWNTPVLNLLSKNWTTDRLSVICVDGTCQNLDNFLVSNRVLWATMRPTLPLLALSGLSRLGSVESRDIVHHLIFRRIYWSRTPFWHVSLKLIYMCKHLFSPVWRKYFCPLPLFFRLRGTFQFSGRIIPELLLSKNLPISRVSYCKRLRINPWPSISVAHMLFRSQRMRN